MLLSMAAAEGRRVKESFYPVRRYDRRRTASVLPPPLEHLRLSQLSPHASVSDTDYVDDHLCCAGLGEG